MASTPSASATTLWSIQKGSSRSRQSWGDADARLRDVSTDWCVAYGRYVNGSRLKQVTAELRTPAEAIGEYVATVAASGGPSWPMATQPRPEYTTRGKARLDSALPRPRLRIRLRAAFGVNARADVLAALFSNAFDRWVVQLVDSLRNPSRT